MKFNVSFKSEDGSSNNVEFQTGRSSLWRAHDFAEQFPDNPARGGRLSYAWGFFAAKVAGKLAELGLEEGISVEEAVDYLADNWDLDIDEVGGASPLPAGRSK